MYQLIKICFVTLHAYPINVNNLLLTDFSRLVKGNVGWDVKRTAATDVQKKAYKETRKGKVYFVSVIFTVPGGNQVAKKAKKAASTNKRGADGDQKPAAKKAKHN
jgi:hypothetical protein